MTLTTPTHQSVFNHVAWAMHGLYLKIGLEALGLMVLQGEDFLFMLYTRGMAHMALTEGVLQITPNSHATLDELIHLPCPTLPPIPSHPFPAPPHYLLCSCRTNLPRTLPDVVS